MSTDVPGRISRSRVRARYRPATGLLGSHRADGTRSAPDWHHRNVGPGMTDWLDGTFPLSEAKNLFAVALVAVAAALACMAQAAGAAAGPLRWSKATKIDRGNALLGISCPSADLCVAGAGSGLLVSTRPAGGASAWHRVPGSSAAVYGVSCPTTSFCAAVGRGGKILTSRNPAGGAGAWTVSSTRVPTSSGTFPYLSCASPTLCVIVEGGSRSVSSATDPVGGASAWKTARLPRVASSLACVDAHLCLIGTRSGDLLTSKRPAGGGSTWHPEHIIGKPGARDDMTAVACATSRLCFSAGLSGAVGLLQGSKDPTGGERAWG